MIELNSGGKPQIELALTGTNEPRRFLPATIDTSKTYGFLPREENILELPPGITKLFETDGTKILSIHQSYNSTGLIYVQTELSVYALTEDEFFGRAITTTLTKVPLITLENMSFAILTYSLANNVAGAATVAAAWGNVVPINTIESMFDTAGTNLVGTGAQFITLAAGVMTFITGRYRISGWVKASPAATVTPWQARLYKNTAVAGPLFAGAGNEVVAGTNSLVGTHNGMAFFAGEFSFGAPVAIALQVNTPSVGNLGIAQNTGAKEVYAMLQIWKVY